MPKTPAQNLKPDPYFEVETPAKVVQPWKKAQLVASKKLEQQIKNDKKGSHGAVKCDKDAANKSEVTKGNTKPKLAPTSKKGQRKPAAGPMGAAMTKFLQDYKKKHPEASHRDAMEAWKVSKQRKKIVDSLDESERKRRRFC